VVNKDKVGSPYPALLPVQVFDYPVAHLLPQTGPRDPDSWPPQMDPKVAAWREETSHLPTGGNMIYVHVPFCPFICHFCPLYKSKKPSDRKAERREQFVDAMLREIAMWAPRYQHEGAPFTTVYFGGGTPTELEPSQLGRILNALKQSFPFAPDAEITLEGVAGTLADRLDEYMAEGFNRISFGVQTLDPVIRRAVGRGEDLEDYDRLVELLAVRPHIPFNVDMMVGLPNQTIESAISDLHRVSAWGIGSLDVYSYWMVPGTKLWEGVTGGRKASPTYGARLLDFRVAAKHAMSELGFKAVAAEAHVRTDINNFMKTTFGGGGNALGTALAFGPSANGFLNGTYFRDVPDLEQYLDAIDRGLLPFQCSTKIDLATAQRRAALMGIQRLTIPRAAIDTNSSRRKIVGRWLEQGLADEKDESYDLTEWGAVWFNQMQLEMMPLGQRLKMSRMLGSAKEQLRTLSNSPEESNGLSREFAQAVRNGDGVMGSLRMAAYKTYLQVKRLPLLDHNAFNFAGKIEKNPPKTDA
jgi:coproporphyrinogen III oxidase-like Fe-S oxidoreductase